MAAVNANIVVEQTNLAVNPTTNSIGVTVEPINVGIFAGGLSTTDPGGTPGQLQYNFNNTTFAGVANTSVASNGTVTFSNLANLRVNGGVNGYVLQTDGIGTLSWTAQTGGGGGAGNPGGANTQIQYNDSGSFGGYAGFTFDETTGNVAMPTNLTVATNVQSGSFTGNGAGLLGVLTAGSVTSAAQPNITSTGTLTSLTVTNDITSASGIFNGDGGGLSNIAGANVSGGFANVTLVGTTTIQQVKEKVVQNATAATGTVNYDLLTGAIVLQTTDALANFTLNIRGNASTTLDSVMSTDESMTLSFINQNGATAYNPTVFEIDGTTQSVSYSGAGIGIPTPNGNDIFTYNIIKTAGSTFAVFGSRVGYL